MEAEDKLEVHNLMSEALDRNNDHFYRLLEKMNEDSKELKQDRIRLENNLNDAREKSEKEMKNLIRGSRNLILTSLAIPAFLGVLSFTVFVVHAIWPNIF